jgi:hypothetical protein
VGTRSDIHALIDALADEELDAVRALLNAVRAEVVSGDRATNSVA